MVMAHGVMGFMNFSKYRATDRNINYDINLY